MFAVRRALSDPENLKEVIEGLRARGVVDRDLVKDEHALDFLVHEGGAESVVEAAYRFCRYEPGVHVVQTGTGKLEHLESNAASLARPPLPAEDLSLLRRMFGGVDDISGN